MQRAQAAIKKIVPTGLPDLARLLPERRRDPSGITLLAALS
jgi:hypothetical protein